MMKIYHCCPLCKPVSFLIFFILFSVLYTPISFSKTQMTLHPNIDSVKFDDSMNPVNISFKVRKNGKLIKWDTPEVMKASREIMVYDENGVSLSYENLSSSIKFVGAGMDRSKRNYEMVGFIDRNYSGKKELVLSFYFKGHKESPAMVTLAIPETNLKILTSMDSLFAQQKKTAYHLSRMGLLWFAIGGMVIFAIFAILFNYHKTSLLMRKTNEHYKTDISRMINSDENESESKMLDVINSIGNYMDDVKEKHLEIRQTTESLRYKTEKVSNINADIKTNTNELLLGYKKIGINLDDLIDKSTPDMIVKLNEIKTLLSTERKGNESVGMDIEKQQRILEEMQSSLPKYIKDLTKIDDILFNYRKKHIGLNSLLNKIKNNSLTLSKIYLNFEELNGKINKSFEKKLEVDDFYRFMSKGLVIRSADTFKPNNS